MIDHGALEIAISSFAPGEDVEIELEYELEIKLGCFLASIYSYETGSYYLANGKIAEDVFGRLAREPGHSSDELAAIVLSEVNKSKESQRR